MSSGFLEDIALSLKDAIQVKEGRRTVPQIVVKQRVEVVLDKKWLEKIL